MVDMNSIERQPLTAGHCTLPPTTGESMRVSPHHGAEWNSFADGCNFWSQLFTFSQVIKKARVVQYSQAYTLRVFVVSTCCDPWGDHSPWWFLSCFQSACLVVYVWGSSFVRMRVHTVKERMAVVVYLLASSCCWGPGVNATSIQRNPTTKPNILLLFPDEWRWDWQSLRAGVTPSDPVIDVATPNFNSIASKGTVFAHA